MKKKHNLCFGVFGSSGNLILGFMTKKDAEVRCMGDFMGVFDKKGDLIDSYDDYLDVYREEWYRDDPEQDFIDARKYWLTIIHLGDKYELDEESQSCFLIDDEMVDDVVLFLKKEGLTEIDVSRWNII